MMVSTLQHKQNGFAAISREIAEKHHTNLGTR